MRPDDPGIREFLAAALRQERQSWPTAWADPETVDAVVRATHFHGIAGLLVEGSPSIGGWPAEFTGRLFDEARARAMWELRHKQLLTALLAKFADRSVPCLVMKGTAVAYDLYPNPAARSRGDTDLLVAAKDVVEAKALLTVLGYAGGVLGGVSPEFALQQVWTLSLPDGGSHTIDLHWQVMNAPSLKHLLGVSECFSHSRELPGVSPEARTMDRVRLLVHTCLHRAMQRNAAYVVDGTTYFDPGRLIWSVDIHLIASALKFDDWEELLSLAAGMKVSGPCLEALHAAHADLGTEVPPQVMRDLADAANGEARSPYFNRSHAVTRALADTAAADGIGMKLRYMASRVVTTEQFLRAEYPAMAMRPLPLLYGRRLLELFRGKRRAG